MEVARKERNEVAFGDVRSIVQLPSRRFKYAVWHDLKDHHVTGEELRCPRVRLGLPLSEQRHDPDIGGETGDREIPELHSLTGQQHRRHRDAAENWESVKAVTLSHQGLGDPYQLKNCMRIMGRLSEAVFITLADNQIDSLSSVTFPRCEVLNLSGNYITSFKALPKVPQLKHLILDDNLICRLNGIERFRESKIQSLSLKGNEVALSLQYRRRVFWRLPRLNWLDDLPKLIPEDSEPPTVKETSTCHVM